MVTFGCEKNASLIDERLNLNKIDWRRLLIYLHVIKSTHARVDRHVSCIFQTSNIVASIKHVKEMHACVLFNDIVMNTHFILFRIYSFPNLL